MIHAVNSPLALEHSRPHAIRRVARFGGARTVHRRAVAAALLALASWSLLTPARAASAPAPGVAGAASARAGAAPADKRAPTRWIVYDDETVTPVIDDVSAQLAAARAALAAGDQAKAAASLQAAAQDLQAQADAVAKLERRRAAADMTLARDTHKRILALVDKLNATAAQVVAGKITSTAQVDTTIDKASRDDLDRRWLVSDVKSWYPVDEEPQRHFGNALAMYAKKDFKAAATEVRRGAAFVRLESARATGEAKSELDDAAAELQGTAQQLESGTVSSESTLQRSFGRADHALAVGHRAKAAEDWSRKSYERAGYELQAAAHGLKAAASWSADKVDPGAATAAAEAQAVGDKLARGGIWTREEVARAFDSLSQTLDHVGQALGVKKKVQPFDTGAGA